MVRDRLLRGVLCLIVLGATALALVGCGGGDGGGTPEPTGNSTITGRVVDASDVTQGLANAQLSIAVPAASRGRAVSTSSSGAFTLTGVPSGVVRVQIKAPSTAFRNGTVDLEVPADGSVEVVITLVPASLPAPDSVTVSPAAASLQVGVPKTFTATVLDAGQHAINVTPTWTVSLGLGTLSSAGVFAGTTPGTGTVTATAGAATGTAAVTVTAATAPQISAVTASPTTLGPSGGQVLFTAQVQSGGRIQSAALRIRRAGSLTATDVPLTPEAGSTDFTASYEQPYTFGPNDSADFAQSITYTVTVVATDERNLSSESDPVTVVVLSADQPPPQPS